MLRLHRRYGRSFDTAVRVLALFAFVACSPAVTPTPPRPTPIYDGGVDLACEQACAKRDAFGCLEADLKAVCAATCERATEAGMFSTVCVLAATSREQLMSACRVRCSP